MCKHDYQPKAIGMCTAGQPAKALYVCSICGDEQWRDAEPGWSWEPTDAEKARLILRSRKQVEMCSHDYQPMRISHYLPGKRPLAMYVCTLCSAIEWRETEPTQQAISAWRHQPTPIPAVFLRAFEGDA